ncbi:HlyD family type I secretion periplasmic adaptor subunit [Gammaproteobacteria bacterium]|nr:HlyD family type I secretion periplasmic adaptor subunit [Gammaproteobacteria bacterium]
MAENLSFIDGEYIFREGETAEYAYIVASGIIEITKISTDGEDILVELEPPSLFGEMALIDGNPRSASARAKGDTTVTEVTSAAFGQYIKQNPEAAIRIMKNISENLRSANQMVAQAGSSLIFSEENSDGPFRARNALWSEIDDTEDIYDRGPSVPFLYTICSLLVFLLLTILFGTLNKVDTTVSARGQFTTRTPNIVVEAGANSVVREISVERGEKVKKDQVIAFLDDTITTANLSQNKQIIRNLEQTLKRFMLEKSYIESDLPIIETKNLDELNFDTLIKRVAEYREKINSFNSKLAKLQTELVAENTIHELTVKQASLKEKIEEVQKNLYEKQVVTLISYLNASDETLNAERSSLNAQNSINRIRAEITTLKSDTKAFIAQWASTLTSDITSVNEQLMQAQQEKIKLTQLAGGVIVTAPVEGIVLDLPAVAEGAIVKEGDKILTLVQANEPLYLEVDIDPKDISDVQVGLSTSVKIDAMPFQKYGDIKGEVIFVSQDTFPESLGGEKGFYYRGRVKIRPLSESAMPADFLINQGMLASVDIKVGQRRLISYFTYPITRAFDESFREPE